MGLVATGLDGDELATDVLATEELDCALVTVGMVTVVGRVVTVVTVDC